jgi:hypothetical protein
VSLFAAKALSGKLRFAANTPPAATAEDLRKWRREVAEVALGSSFIVLRG